MTQRQRPDNDPKFSPLVASAWNIVGGMLGCSLLGYLIGQRAGDFMTGTLVGMFVGLLYCGYEIWKFLRESKKK